MNSEDDEISNSDELDDEEDSESEESIEESSSGSSGDDDEGKPKRNEKKDSDSDEDEEKLDKDSFKINVVMNRSKLSGTPDSSEIQSPLRKIDMPMSITVGGLDES